MMPVRYVISITLVLLLFGVVAGYWLIGGRYNFSDPGRSTNTPAQSASVGSDSESGYPQTPSVQADISAPVAWWRAGKSDEALAPPILRDVQNAVLVKLDQDYLAGIERRGELLITIPQTGKNYPAVIEKTVQSRAGNLSVSGYMGAPPYSFLLTLGAKNTYATLNTPDGIYSLFGTRELAWIVRAAELDRHVDFSKPDFIIPGDDASRMPVTNGG